MADERAFTLKADFADNFAGASVAVGPDGATLNIGDIVKSHKQGREGFIVVTDELDILACENCEALKSASLTEAKARAKEPAPTKTESKE